MRTKKYATPVGYSFSIGAKNVSIPISDNLQYDIGTIPDAEGKRLYATAVDSRYFTAQCFKDIPLLPYHKPSLFIKTKRKNDFENETKIEINGEMSSLMVNSERKNKILSLKMRYKEVNGIFSEYINLEPVIDAYKYSINPYFLDLDREKQYLLEVTVTDKLSTTVQNVVVVRGIAIFFISTDRETCYIKDKEVVVRTDDNIANINGLYNKSGSTLAFDTDTTVENNDWVLTNDNGNVKRRNISRDLDGRGTFNMNNDNRHLDFNNTNRRRHLLTAESMAWWNGCYNQDQNSNWSNLEYCIQGRIQAKPTILFDNGNGQKGDISLSDNVNNYDRVVIYYKDTETHANSSLIVTRNYYKYIILSILIPYPDLDIKVKVNKYLIKERSLLLDNAKVTNLKADRNNRYDANDIAILKVDKRPTFKRS